MCRSKFLHTSPRGHTLGRASGGKGREDSELGMWRLSCLTFSQAVKEPSLPQRHLLLSEVGLVAPPWTSFSASVHYMNHSIKCNLSSKYDWKSKWNFKNPKKNSMAGLGCSLLCLHFSPTLSHLPFQACFTKQSFRRRQCRTVTSGSGLMAAPSPGSFP